MSFGGKAGSFVEKQFVVGIDRFVHEQRAVKAGGGGGGGGLAIDESKPSSTLSTDVRFIADSIDQYGVTPSGSVMMKQEAAAARASIESGIYISFLPHPSCRLTEAAHEGLRDGTSQCCRVGPESSCVNCGHSLSQHGSVKSKKHNHFIRPPTCQHCTKCPGFSYCPSQPEGTTCPDSHYVHSSQ